MITGIVCNNREEARIVVKLLYNSGFKWNSDIVASKQLDEDINECVNETYWSDYAEINMYIADDEDMSIICPYTIKDRDINIGLILNAPDFIKLVEER